MGLNPHGEITAILFPGKVCLKKAVILKSIQKASEYSKNIAQTMVTIIDQQCEIMKSNFNAKIGFVDKIKSDKLYYQKQMDKRLEIMKGLKSSGKLLEVNIDNEEQNNEMETSMQDPQSSSEEEFPAELKNKSLPQIKALKKRKLKKES